MGFVREHIESACARCGRDSAGVTLVAVTKYVTPDVAAALHECGVFDLGENRVQELEKKADALPSTVRWHHIGNLQRNKTRKAVERAVLLHGIDSAEIAYGASEKALELGKRIPILIEVNISGEKTKHGLGQSEVPAVLEKCLTFRGIELRGLMTMAPLSEEPEQSRRFFASLRELSRTLQERHGLPVPCELSMGMSQDFEVAIEEGATIIRVGSLLFRDLV